MPRRHRPSLVLATTAVLAIALASTLAACGGGDDNSTSSSTTSPSTATTGGGETMSVQSISGVGDVLVDADGNVLYTNDKDTGNKPACTGECAAVWVPLTVPTGSTVNVNSSDVPGSVGVITLADGSSQVTYNDKPLYSFVEDGGPGKATGDGVTDSFGGVSFTWTAATPSGSAKSAAATDTTSTTATTSGSSSSGSSGSSSGGSSGGGYGY